MGTNSVKPSTMPSSNAFNAMTISPSSSSQPPR
jgi:hypothetical protein